MKKLTALGLSTLFAATAFSSETTSLTLQGDIAWTSDTLKGGYLDKNRQWIDIEETWTNNTAADFAATGALKLIVDNAVGSVAASGLTVSGGKLVTVTGGELTILEGGAIEATGSGTGVSIDSTVNFENGGSLSGNVTTTESGTIKVSSGTLTSANISGDGMLYIAEGARVEKTNIITANYTQAVKLAGMGTYAVSTQKSNSFVGEMSFSGSATEGFKGILEIDGYTGRDSAGKTDWGGRVFLSNFFGTVKIFGNLNLSESDFGNASKIVWAKNGTAWLGDSYSSKTLIQDLEVLSGTTLCFYGLYDYLFWGGEVYGGGCIEFHLGGTSYKNFTFKKTVNLDTLSIESGNIAFCGASSQLKQFKGSTATFWDDGGFYDDFLTIASGATLTITGEANAEKPHEGAFILGTEKEQIVNVEGVLNLENDGMSNINGNGIVNISGEMNFNAGLFVNDDNNQDNSVVLNVKNGAHINIGGIGMDSAGTFALNLEGAATIGSLSEEWNIDRALKISDTLTIDTEKRDLNFDGAAKGTGKGSWVSAEGKISGDGSLVKKGAGTLVLNNENTYTGGTTVEGGALYVYRSDALGSGGLTVKGGAEALLSVGFNDRGNITFNEENALAVEQGGRAVIEGFSTGTTDYYAHVTVARTTVAGAGTLDVGSLGVLELSGGKLNVSGALVNAGTLNIIAQVDGVNSGVVLRDGATFTNTGTIVISAGTLAEGQSVTVFADAAGSGILDSTGTVKGSGEIKVFGGYYEDGVFTAGEKKEVDADEALVGLEVKAGESVVITDRTHMDGKMQRYHAVTLSSNSEMVLSKVHNHNYERVELTTGEFVEVAASWGFEFEKKGEVLVVMNVGTGLSLDTIKILHNGHKVQGWEDYTDKVGNISYDAKTGYLAFTTTEFSSYAVTGTFDSVNVPEPSAFGLLAGLGALALVASRRRRK